MRNRDTVRVRIAGARTWIDPGVLTQALARQEAHMDRVTAWSENGGDTMCRECADDARAGGALLKQARVEKGRVCDGCGQEIGNGDE